MNQLLDLKILSNSWCWVHLKRGVHFQTKSYWVVESADVNKKGPNGEDTSAIMISNQDSYANRVISNDGEGSQLPEKKKKIKQMVKE